MAASLLPGALSAQVFTTRTAVSGAPSKIGISLSYGFAGAEIASKPGTIDAGAWEITVGFDPARCEVYCQYRRKSPAPLGASLPPPVADILVYTDSVSTPTRFTVDPAGLRSPVLSAPEFSRPLEIDKTKIRETSFTEQPAGRPFMSPAQIVGHLTAPVKTGSATRSRRI